MTRPPLPGGSARPCGEVTATGYIIHSEEEFQGSAASKRPSSPLPFPARQTAPRKSHPQGSSQGPAMPRPFPCPSFVQGAPPALTTPPGSRPSSLQVPPQPPRPRPHDAAPGSASTRLSCQLLATSQRLPGLRKVPKPPTVRLPPSQTALVRPPREPLQPEMNTPSLEPSRPPKTARPLAYLSPRCLRLLTATASRSRLPTAAQQAALPLAEST